MSSRARTAFVSLALVASAMVPVRTHAQVSVLTERYDGARTGANLAETALTTSNVLRPGLAGLVKTLTAELAPIRINGLAPGRIATDRIASLDANRAEADGTTPEAVAERMRAQIPLGRYGDPSEIGRIGAFLLSPAASYVTGAIVPVDGGLVRALP